MQTITVIGSSGQQGSHVVKALLETGKFKVRAVSRNPTSEKFQQLFGQYKTDMNFEVVQADLNSVESLERVFQDVYGVFGVTNFWEVFNPQVELQQATNLAQAAKHCGVKHFVWSTLEDTRKYVKDEHDIPTLMGNYKVPHFDAKGQADNIFRELAVPTTFLLTSFYWSNFVYFGMGPQNGKLTLPIHEPMPGMNMETLGDVVAKIFQRPDLIGQYVGVSDEHLTLSEICEKYTKQTGSLVEPNYVPPEVYASFGFPGAEDLANMFKFYDVCNVDFRAARSTQKLKELFPDVELRGLDYFLQTK
jgi:uncharacterized protein YbjT (DUF2867 family)